MGKNQYLYYRSVVPCSFCFYLRLHNTNYPSTLLSIFYLFRAVNERVTDTAVVHAKLEHAINVRECEAELLHTVVVLRGWSDEWVSLMRDENPAFPIYHSLESILPRLSVLSFPGNVRFAP